MDSFASRRGHESCGRKQERAAAAAAPQPAQAQPATVSYEFR
jgi:hypothetical protein